MATVTTQIPKDYRDLDLNFTIHPVRKDINKHVGPLAVVNAIKNLILTNHYERPFQPDLGSNIRRLLFENIDSIVANKIEQEISQVIANFEPRAKVTKITTIPKYDDNAYQVELEFFVINRTEPINIKFLLERIR
jgi:phage baseplate assembly protein W